MKSLLAAITLLALPFASLAAEIPPIPKGYGSELEIKAAILLKQIPLISVPKDPPAGVREITGLTYSKTPEKELKLDIILPPSTNKPLPCLVFIHGGAWKGGKREDYRVYTLHFASLGYVCATISYRFSQEAPYPAAVIDCRNAVRWIRDHAAEYSIDPNRIAALGGSAGGHLAMMLGYAPNLQLEGDTVSKTSAAVQAVVDFYGPADLTTDFGQKADVVVKFMGGKPYTEAPELWKQASPLTHLTKDAPPTLIFHGTIDTVVPIDQADTLAARLKQLGVPSDYERFEGWPHTMDLAEPVNARTRWKAALFLRKHLGEL